MDNSEQTVKLEFDERLFVLLSKDLYKDKLSFLRELTQNSADAGATEIKWIIDKDSRTITEIDNGKGMTYEFALNDWKKVGKSFKKGSEIGMYGIGRLSIWQVAESVVIQTRDIEIVWNSISEYKIRKTNDFVNGFICKIKVREEEKDKLDEWTVKYYLERNTNLENILIRVNDKLIRPIRYEYIFRVEIPEEKAVLFIKEPKDSWDAVKIFEKGLLVKSVYNSKVECLIDFNKPIKTLSRESTTISEQEIYDVIFKGVKKLVKSHLEDLELRKIYFEEIKKLALTISYFAYRNNSKELAELYPIEDGVLKDYKSFYYSKESALVDRAKEKGYNVLIVETPEELECCRLAGLKPLSDLKDKLKRVFFVHKTESEKGKRILSSCADYMQTLTKIAQEISSKFENKKSGVSIKTDRLKELEEQYNKDISNLDLETVEEGSGEIKYTLGNLAFGTNEDKNITAWQSGSYTVLNLENSLVQKLLETERLDLIEETLTHEFVHRLGYRWHDEAFVGAYNTLRHEILEFKAENSARFESKAQISKISEKYEQALIKIPKEAVDKLKISKGQELTVVLEPKVSEENKEEQ